MPVGQMGLKNTGKSRAVGYTDFYAGRNPGTTPGSRPASPGGSTSMQPARGQVPGSSRSPSTQIYKGKADDEGDQRAEALRRRLKNLKKSKPKRR